MKKLINFIKNKPRKIFANTVLVLVNNRGEGFLDTALQILISIIIGSLLLAGLYTLFGDTILPNLTEKITSLFNYAG